MSLTIAKQDYLEMILFLDREQKVIRSVDLAIRLNVSRAAVSKSLLILKEQGLIEMPKYGLIKLTDQGRKIAQQVMDKHRLLTDFLVKIGVEEHVAETDACKIEHILSKESIEKIIAFMNQ
jgi:DtxR family transcriptional regulator, Mn-dependent transcriptional regulator